MFVHVTASQDLTVGNAMVVHGESPSANLAAVFEDDGQTGYFYALDLSFGSQPIVDAAHIYNVQQVEDRDVPSTIKVGWSANGKSAVLLINDYPHAVFDFQAKLGYCRSGFPSGSLDSAWSKDGHGWSDEALNLFSSCEP